jgi:hypothetical protein
MSNLTLIPLLVATAVALLAATYLLSKDSGRRERARELLRLLVGR